MHTLRYHHVTVLAFCFCAFIFRHPGIYFATINYMVHAFMYSYYFLSKLVN